MVTINDINTWATQLEI